MNAVELRNELHEFIERADDRHLEAIYILVSEDVKRVSSHNYDVSEIEMLHKRREAHLSGESKSLTVEESIELIRSGKR